MKTVYSLEYLQQYSNDYDIVPVAVKVLSDIRTPIGVLRTLRKMSDKCFLLESVESSESIGRYSFLGYDPKVELVLKQGEMQIVSGVVNKVKTSDPNQQIREVLSEYKSPRLDKLPPFTGGLAGYFAFEYAGYYEKLKFSNKDIANVADMHLMLFDKVIAYDNYRQEIYIIINVKTSSLKQSYFRACEEIDTLLHLFKTDRHENEEKLVVEPFVSEYDEKKYSAVVEKARKYIYEGDIFQVVPSICKTAKAKGSMLEAFRYLRSTNPSPYMFYFKVGDELEITGASPETLVKKIDKKLTTYPIAGTKPRGATPQEDETLANELLNDPKECSEHNMLVDLGRNDLGKVSRIGSVKVAQYKICRKFSHVMHLCSTVESEIDDSKDALDALAAVFPAGTLSGAPKRRACEIIEELENTRRGVYGGAVGYIDFSGNMDMCIAIRTAVKSNGTIVVRSGGGVVADSVASAEYRETVNKAEAVVGACLLASSSEE